MAWLFGKKYIYIFAHLKVMAAVFFQCLILISFLKEDNLDSESLDDI